MSKSILKEMLKFFRLNGENTRQKQEGRKNTKKPMFLLRYSSIQLVFVNYSTIVSIVSAMESDK